MFAGRFSGTQLIGPRAVAAPAAAEPPAEIALLRENRYIDAKLRIHRRLIDDLNLTAIEAMPRDELAAKLGDIIGGYMRDEKVVLNAVEREAFVAEVIDEMTGLGPLEPLLKDPSVADILINSHNRVFVERAGKMVQTSARFKDEEHLMRVVNRIVAAVGRRVDESQPLCDARLPDGSRVNVAVRPVAVDGPLVSIRKFSTEPFTLARLVEKGSLARPMAEILALAVRHRFSLVVSGGTGSGKTTLLNALSRYIGDGERVITIEDAAELQLQQPHVGRLETRPPNIEGKGEIKQRELLKNALRMRPDRIILGECRGEEAFDMLQAMNTGHDGSMATVHANSPRDALTRLEQMVGMAGLPMTVLGVRQQLASAIDIIVQLQRMSDGRRRIVSVAEVIGVESDIIQTHEIFRFARTGATEAGDIVGSFRANGLRPKFLNELAGRGVALPAFDFDPAREL